MGDLELIAAIDNGDCELVAQLLDGGSVDLDAPYASVPLVVAAAAGQARVASLLLERGAEVDARGADGGTALHVASREGHVDVVRELLQHGASMEVRDGGGFTPLVRAVQAANGADVVEVLLEAGARPDVRTNVHFTALHFAAYGDVDVLRLLLAEPRVVAQVDARSMDVHGGCSALHLATQRGYVEHAMLLIGAGASVSMRTASGATVLHLAAKQHRAEMVKKLLRMGAEVDARDDSGGTPLMAVAQSVHRRYTEAPRIACVRSLLEYGADRDLRNNRRKTVRDLAADRGSRWDDVCYVLRRYFPVKLQMEQLLLGLRGGCESVLGRFAAHRMFEPKVLSIVAAFASGKDSGAFDKLQQEMASAAG